MKRVPLHIPPFSDKADHHVGFTGLSRKEKLEYVQPLLVSENALYETLRRGDWGEGAAFALKELMERLPCSYMERKPPAYAGFFRITNALARLGWPDEVLGDILNIAAETETHDPLEKMKPHWDELGEIDFRVNENDAISTKAYKTVYRRGVFLALVPGEHLTYEMCEEAVRTDWRALQFVPQEMRDAQIFQSARIGYWMEVKAVSQIRNRERKALYDSIKAGHASPEAEAEILERYGLINLRGEFQELGPYVPQDAASLYFEQLPVGLQEKRFDEMRYALGYNYAQEWKKKSGICKTSLKGENLALFRKLEAQVRMDGDGRSIESEKPSKAVCMELVKNYAECLQYLPADRIDRKICMAAIRKDPMALRDVRETLIDKPTVMAAVARNGLALQFVPERLMDREIEETACSQNPDARYFCMPKKESIKERKEREWQEQYDEWLDAKERMKQGNPKDGGSRLPAGKWQGMML